MTQNIYVIISEYSLKKFDGGGGDYKIIDGKKNWPGAHGKALVGCSWERRTLAEDGFGEFWLGFEGLS